MLHQRTWILFPFSFAALHSYVRSKCTSCSEAGLCIEPPPIGSASSQRNISNSAQVSNKLIIDVYMISKFVYYYPELAPHIFMISINQGI